MRRYLMILCAALLACACAQEIEQVEVYELGCPRPTVKKEAQPDTAAFKIYSNGEYSGVIDAEWLSVDEFPGQRKFNGYGDGVLTLSFAHNEGDTRTGTVTLTRHTRTVILTVVQRGDLTVDPGVLAELKAASSSTLTFCFGEGDTVSEQCSYPYSFGLFADEAMQDTIVFHKVPKGTLVWNKSMPAFTFGGLEQGTDYYFHVQNPETGKKSEPMKVSTKDFEVVVAGVNDMAVGGVILAEDFSELPWNGDEVNGAAGWRAKDTTVFAMPAGTSAEGYFGNRSYESPLMDKSGCGVAFASSRLSGWCVADQTGAPAGKTVFARPGYLKLGGYSYVPAIVTPELGEIPVGKTAAVKVEFTASRYSSDNPSVVVSVVRGEAVGNSFKVDDQSRRDEHLDLGSKPEWGNYSVTIGGVRTGSRVLIGPDAAKIGSGKGKSQHRMFIDDIKVTLVSLDDNGLKVEAEHVASSSSTLTFRFGEGEDVAEKCSYNYTIALYEDEALSQKAISHTIPADANVWGDKMPAFTFAGLEQNTTYYFQAVNQVTGKKSGVIPAATEAFEVVVSGDVQAADGAVILAEDFSELSWNGDHINSAAGWRSSDLTSFEYPSADGPAGTFGNSAYENPLFHADGAQAAVASGRLAQWSMYQQEGLSATGNNMKPMIVRPGYVKMGGYSWCTAIVTPHLTGIPADRLANVKVEFTASCHGTDDTRIAASLVKGTVNSYVFTPASRTDVQITMESNEGWNTYTAEFKGVRADDRIMIGPDMETTGKGGGKSQQRMYLSDLKVIVTGEPAVDLKPAGLMVTGLYYSDAKVKWSPSEADSFNIYLDGSLIETVTRPEYHFIGLSNSTEYTFAVGAVKNGEEVLSEQHAFTTKGVRVVEQARTHICVEWDDLVTTAVKTKYDSGKSSQENINVSNKEGQDRAYEMVLYADQGCTQPLVTLYPYDGIFLDRFIFNDGAYLRTGSNAQYWNGVSAGVPRRMATRISIGCLEAGTDYWFRVRSVEAFDVAGTRYSSTMTNPAGTSEWSEPLKVSTAPERVSLQNEVIFNGFDQFSIQKDQHNLCSGIQPKIAHDATEERKAFDGTLLKDFEYELTLLAWRGQGDFKKTHDYGFVSQVEGDSKDDTYFGASTYGGKNNYVDKSGWHFVGNTSPEMGYLHLDTGPDVAVGTPALESNLSADAETPCRLTFNAFAIHQTYLASDKTAKVKVSVYRDGALQQEKEMTIPYKYKNQSPSPDNFIPDTSWNEYSADLSLKKGDAVLIFNNAGSYRWMIDDILILKK